LKQAITTYCTAFPDLKATVDDIFPKATEWHTAGARAGTHLGDWLGIPPTVTTWRQPGSPSSGSLEEKWWRAGQPWT
jgi:hypothetical protein